MILTEPRTALSSHVHLRQLCIIHGWIYVYLQYSLCIDIMRSGCQGAALTPSREDGSGAALTPLTRGWVGRRFGSLAAEEGVLFCR